MFKEHWTLITQAIKAKAPDAKITVNRLYNPLANNDPLYSLSKTYIQQINAEIDLKATLATK